MSRSGGTLVRCLRHHMSTAAGDDPKTGGVNVVVKPIYYCEEVHIDIR